MRLVVLGAGRMGEHLIRQLSGLPEHHDITLVERDPETRIHLQRKYDIGIAEGDARVPAVLTQHCSGADVLFALTNYDATNMLAALTATDPAIGVKRAVVRLSDQRHRENPLLAEGGRQQTIETIFPEELVAEEILGILRYPGARSVRSFGQGVLVLLRATPRDSTVFDRPLEEIDTAPRGWMLTGILRSGDGHLEIPRGRTRVQEGDEVFAVGPAVEARNYLKAIGVDQRPAQRVVIAGLGQVGHRLGELLLDEQVDLTAIRRHPASGFPLAAHTIVGDATDEDILQEAGVGGADFFVAATDADEVNLMAAHLAKKLGAQRTVALHNRDDLHEAMQDLGVDHPISPGEVSAGALMKLLHTRAMVRLDFVEGGGELVEIEVAQGSPATRAPLRRLGLPHTCIIGEVVRARSAPFVPNGDTEFVAGDRVALFMSQHAEGRSGEPDSLLSELEELFGRPN